MLTYSSHQIYRDPRYSGTMGGYFTFGGSDVFAISNNHVMANINNCNVGDLIKLTGSTVLLGQLQYWVLLNNNANYLDVALAKVDRSILPGWRMQSGTVLPAGFRQARQGEKVYMVLPSGILSWGTVSNPTTNNSVTFELLGQDFPFFGLIEIDGGGSPFSVPGDSGALIFSEDDYIVGLNMGTSLIAPSLSYAVPFVNGTRGILALYNLQIWRPI